jgi:hypothetical protein
MANVKLRPDQYKRLGRLTAKNPDRAEKVGARMTERRSRMQRGKEFFEKNVDKLTPKVPTMAKKGTKVAPKKAYGGMMMKKGGKMKKSK